MGRGPSAFLAPELRQGTPPVSTSHDPTTPPAPPAELPSPPSLVAGLPRGERERLLPALQRVHLDLKRVLYQPGEEIAHVYFPIDSLVSLLTVLNDGEAIETGMAGRDGMAGLPVFLGVPLADRRAVCQVGGDAWRLSTDAFRAALVADGALAARLAR